MIRTVFHPRVPRPPDDPQFWLLDARVGWRPLDPDTAGLMAAPHLSLAVRPESGRRLTEPSGSFGGLALPVNVAIGPQHGVYLLDQASWTLMRFDPCECIFTTVSCLGSHFAVPRATGAAGPVEIPRCGAKTTPVPHRDPRSIGICGGDLYVCDTWNHRLLVFALRGLVLRSVWEPPARQVSRPWLPTTVAFDRQGRVWVGDSGNGCLHRFNRLGHHECRIGKLDGPSNIAIDCDDRVYVLTGDTELALTVMTMEGTELDPPARPEDVADRFPALPFEIDAAGNLHLGQWCAESKAEGEGVFDLSGTPTAPAPTPLLAYEKATTFISQPLDSKIYRCPWHRVILSGTIPKGTRVVVATYTSETEESAEGILGLPAESWSGASTARSVSDGEWDTLIRSTGGRYLWLKLVLSGNGGATPALESVRVEYPRTSLRRYLPGVFGHDPIGADFTDRFLAVFDTTLRSIERHVDHQAGLFDPLSAPTTIDPDTGLDFLSWLASWIGVALDRQLPDGKRRRLLRDAARLYPIRGTKTALREQLLTWLGMRSASRCCAAIRPRDRCVPLPENCPPAGKPTPAWEPPPLILELWQLRRWLFLDHGRLGDQAKLWGQSLVNRSQLNATARVGGTMLNTRQDPLRDPFHYYAHHFSVFIPECYRDDRSRRKALERLLAAERPAHTVCHLEFVAPRFRIGVQATIGLNSVVGRYPSGIALDGKSTPLGQASVLSEPAHRRGGPSMEIGRNARIGTTTMLN